MVVTMAGMCCVARGSRLGGRHCSCRMSSLNSSTYLETHSKHQWAPCWAVQELAVLAAEALQRRELPRKEHPRNRLQCEPAAFQCCAPDSRACSHMVADECCMTARHCCIAQRGFLATRKFGKSAPPLAEDGGFLAQLCSTGDDLIIHVCEVAHVLYLVTQDR